MAAEHRPDIVPMLQLCDVAKTFTMHLQGALTLPAVAGVTFAVAPGECVVLGGPSGTGKSTIMKMVAGTYAASAGTILVRTPSGVVDLVGAMPREVLAMRRSTIANVTQFLRVIPRVSARDLVTAAAGDRARAEALLDRLNLPDRLWDLPPATFSGGEKQRVNLAIGFARPLPLLLLDEPTASLDDANKQVVIAMIAERRAQSAAILGIFHDAAVREAVADRIVDVRAFAPRQAA